MIADVVVVLDEGADLPFEVASQIIVVEAGCGSPRRLLNSILMIVDQAVIKFWL
jgi:hypothetical protein